MMPIQKIDNFIEECLGAAAVQPMLAILLGPSCNMSVECVQVYTMLQCIPLLAQATFRREVQLMSR